MRIRGRNFPKQRESRFARSIGTNSRRAVATRATSFPLAFARVKREECFPSSCNSLQSARMDISAAYFRSRTKYVSIGYLIRQRRGEFLSRRNERRERRSFPRLQLVPRASSAQGSPAAEIMRLDFADDSHQCLESTQDPLPFAENFPVASFYLLARCVPADFLRVRATSCVYSFTQTRCTNRHVIVFFRP